MKTKLTICIIMLLAFFASSAVFGMPECDSSPSQIKAQKSVKDFINANSAFLKYEQGKVVFRKIKNSCYYRYQEYLEVRGKRKYSPNYIVDQYGDVIDVESELVILKYNCPRVSLTQEYFEKRIEKLRKESSIGEKPNDPYKVDFRKIKCLYEVREIPVSDKERDKYFSDFIFDYKGNLYKSYFHIDEKGKLAPESLKND